MSVAALIADLRRRNVELIPRAGDRLRVRAPTGLLTEADLAVLRRRKATILAFLRWETRGGAPVLLSAAWPGPGSWQHVSATVGRHPLACPTCEARTLRRADDGRLVCAAGCGVIVAEGPR